MSDVEALDRIKRLLDGVVLDLDDLEIVRDLVRRTGRKVRDVEDCDHRDAMDSPELRE